MRNFILFCFTILISVPLLAKKQATDSKNGLPFFYERIVPIEFPEDIYFENVDDIEKMLEQLSTKLLNQNKTTGLKLISQKQSMGMQHYLFQETINGIAVYGAFIKINLSNDGKLLSFSNGSLSQLYHENRDSNASKTLNSDQIIEKWLTDKKWSKEQIAQAEKILLYDGNNFKNAVRLIIDDVPNVYYSEWLIDEQGKTIAEKDLNAYRDRSNASALVFLPDPLTSAEEFYGGNYIDSSDTDVPAINNELKNVSIDVFSNQGNYYLNSDYVSIENLSPPNLAPPAPSTPSFEYQRHEDNFEAVNAYFHINRFAAHIKSIGFEFLLNKQVSVDANGLNGQDQSIFTPSIAPRINFGEGGVDDAEDADVVVHEYGHYLSYAAAPATNEGFERRSLDEGLCDYFAASYSKDLSIFRWYDIFTWDGHNEYWDGREANELKKYPDDIVSSSIHSNGEIFASAMMDVQEQLGRTVTDQLVLQSMYSYYPNMSMRDAGNLVLQADSALFNGKNYCTIFGILNSYGMCDESRLQFCLRKDAQIEMPNLKYVRICPGDSIQLIDASTINPEYDYNWTPDYKLELIGGTVARVFPDSTTNYQLEIITPDGRFNNSFSSVVVAKCKLEFLNSQAFLTGTGAVILALPEITSLRPQWIRLINIHGNVLRKWNINETDATWELLPDGLPNGAYILQMRMNNGDYKTQKLLKLQ